MSNPKGDVSLSEDQIKILMASSKKTRDEILEWHKNFLEEHPTGELNKQKFTELYQEFFPSGRVTKYCTHIFPLFDTDHSGSISFSEMLLGLALLAKTDKREKLGVQFDIIDYNKDGSITKKEMGKMIIAMYDVMGLHENQRTGDMEPKYVMEKIFAKFDRDLNGTLSKEEYIEGCLSNPALCKVLTDV